MLRPIYRFGLLALLWSTQGQAVDSGRLWLPAHYQSAMPKLQAVAALAENSQRCVEVVTGKMLLNKSTAEHYYFLITCRDTTNRTFNLSYRSPTAEGPPVLAAEQRSGAVSGAVPADAAEKGISREQALVLCRKEFPAAATALDEVELLEDADVQVVSRGDSFFAALPFTAQSDLGKRVLYQAECTASSEGYTTYELVLQRQGALTLCKEQLRAEAIFLGRSRVNDEAVSAIDSSEGFRFDIPFQVKTLTLDRVDYHSDCRVTPEGEVELTITLQPAGALAICREQLRRETLLMKAVSVADTPISERQEEGEFWVEMGFEANSPDGNLRRFRAQCRVDAEGEATVQTALDKSAITAVCLHGVKAETRTMIGVEILADQVPPLQQDANGFFAEIPFDARDPNGRLLHYQGECRVDEVGRTRVTLKPRHFP